MQIYLISSWITS